MWIRIIVQCGGKDRVPLRVGACPFYLDTVWVIVGFFGD